MLSLLNMPFNRLLTISYSYHLPINKSNSLFFFLSVWKIAFPKLCIVVQNSKLS